ncbi:MAG: pyridoxamine 5'-phosphate oxidase family protein [Spirochaetota bacterium]
MKDIRRKDREIKDSDIISKLLTEEPVCRLALSDNNDPYIVPMNFAFHEGRIYLHSAPEGRKLDILKKNNRVCLEIDTNDGVIPGRKPCSFGFAYSSVILFGKASIINDLNEKRSALRLLADKYIGGLYSFTEVDMEGVEVIRVEVEKTTGKSSRRN